MAPARIPKTEFRRCRSLGWHYQLSIEFVEIQRVSPYRDPHKTKKGAQRLDQVFHGWHRRISGLGVALLAGELYRREVGRSISLWDFCDQCDGFFPGWRDCDCVGHEGALESELGISDPHRFYRGIYDVLHF